MPKIILNTPPQITNILKEFDNLPGKITTSDGKSYSIKKLEVHWKDSEFNRRRHLGRLLAVISFGLLYIFSQNVKDLLNKTKEIHVSARLEADYLTHASSKKTHSAASAKLKEISEDEGQKLQKNSTNTTNHSNPNSPLVEKDEESDSSNKMTDENKDLENHSPGNEINRLSVTRQNVSKSIDFYNLLPIELKDYIESYLALPHLVMFSGTNKTIKAEIDQKIRKHELELILALNLIQRGKFVDKSKKLSEVLQPESMVQLLLMIDKLNFDSSTKIPPTENQKRVLCILNDLLGPHESLKFQKSLNQNDKITQFLFYFENIKGKILTEDFLATLEPEIREEFLDAVLRYSCNVALKQADLYLKFASYATKLSFLEKLSTKDHLITKTNSYILKFYQTWFIKLINEIKEVDRDNFYKYFLKIIHHKLNESKVIEAFSLITEQYPNLTLEDFASYVKQISTEDRDPNCIIRIPQFAAFKAIQICENYDKLDLRIHFNQLYSKLREEQITSASDWYKYKGLRHVFFEFLYKVIVKKIPENQQAKIVQKLTYAINGTGNVDLPLLLNYMTTTEKEEVLLSDYYINFADVVQLKSIELVLIAQQEWVSSMPEIVYMDSDNFLHATSFHQVLGSIDTKDKVMALIKGVKDFVEPKRSLYLRSIAFGIKQLDLIKIKLPIEEMRSAFQESSVDFPNPEIPVHTNDFLFFASPITPFINQVNSISDQTKLKTLLHEIQTGTLPPAQKALYLNILAHRLSNEDVDKKIKVFKALGYELENYPPLSPDEFNNLDPFIRSKLNSILDEEEWGQMIKDTQQLPDSEYKTQLLRALAQSITYPFNHYHLSKNERTEAFASQGLNIEDYLEITLSDFVDQEVKFWIDKISEDHTP